MKGIFSNPDGEKLSFQIKKISGVSSLELLQLLQVLLRPELLNRFEFFDTNFWRRMDTIRDDIISHLSVIITN